MQCKQRNILLLITLLAVVQHVTAQPTEKIDAYIKAMMTKSNIPGLSVAVVHNDSIIFSKGYGITGNDRPITADTPFGIASLSKAFTATAVMQLVEKGKVDLDAPVVKYLPSFVIDDSRGSAITVRQLLNQTSGLSDLGFPEMAFKDQPASLQKAMLRMRTAKLVSDPGTAFHYHNPNYQILAALVESVTKEKYSNYLSEHIFKPLAMNTTQDFPLTDLMYSNDNFSNGHIFFFGKPIAIKEPNWFVDGAGSIVSTSNDMAKWLIFQLNNGQFKNERLLMPENMDKMRISADKTLSGYGMGWFLNTDSVLYHNGILWTYSAQEIIYTKEGYGIVILFNGGMNAFTDYYSFVEGITDIIMLREPEVPVLSYWVYSIIIGVLFLIVVGLCVRSLIRTKRWWHKHESRAIWKTVLYLSARLIPFFLLIFIPQIVAYSAGRVLSWSRIFLIFPDLIIGLGIISFLNLFIIFIRLRCLQQSRSRLK